MEAKSKELRKKMQFAAMLCMLGIMYLSNMKEQIGNVLYWTLFTLIAMVIVYIGFKIKPSKMRILVAGSFILLTVIISTYFLYYR